MKKFEMSIIEVEGNKAINFANNSDDFIEVVFTIDDREVKEGKVLKDTTKGYAYPPKLEKPVKKMKNGQTLLFSKRGGEIVAYIYAGEGKYKDKDIDLPAFSRHNLVSSVNFERKEEEPMEVLRMNY